MQFALLGPLNLIDDSGNRVTLSGVRQRSLLACLLLRANSPVSCDVLIEAVWGTGRGVGSVTMLRSVVMRLRRAMGTGLANRISAHTPGYLVRVETLELDALQFEALCREAGSALRTGRWAAAAHAAADALALCRDEPLLDVESPLLHQQFVPRLEQLRVQALEDRLEAVLNLGGQEELIPELRELVMAHPLRERFRAQLMIALARAGRQAEALEAYREARRTLIGELGVEPGPELRRAQELILAGECLPPAARPSPSPSSSPRAGAGARPAQRKRPHHTRALAVVEPAQTTLNADCWPSFTKTMEDFVVSGHDELLLETTRRLHLHQLKACRTALVGLAPGRHRLLRGTKAFLDSTRRERGACRLLAAARSVNVVVAEVYRRNRRISELLAPDFKALGYQYPEYAAWVWVTMSANVADAELAADGDLPALRSTLVDYLANHAQRPAVR